MHVRSCRSSASSSAERLQWHCELVAASQRLIYIACLRDRATCAMCVLADAAQSQQAADCGSAQGHPANAPMLNLMERCRHSTLQAPYLMHVQRSTCRTTTTPPTALASSTRRACRTAFSTGHCLASLLARPLCSQYASPRQLSAMNTLTLLMGLRNLRNGTDCHQASR